MFNVGNIFKFGRDLEEVSVQVLCFLEEFITTREEI